MSPKPTYPWSGPCLGRPRLHLRQTDSTNERVRALASRGAPHGTLVTADEQTAGRGRQGRRWWASPRSALLMSLLLRFDGGRPPPLLPLAAAVAVSELAGPSALVKWPNDVVLRGAGGSVAKLAGILVEGRPQEGWVALGIGLNVAVDVEEAPVELRGSVATLARSPEDVEPVLEELLSALSRRLADPALETLGAWRARDALLGAEVAWSGGSGVARGIDERGRLIVDLAGGRAAALDSGEVHLLAAR